MEIQVQIRKVNVKPLTAVGPNGVVTSQPREETFLINRETGEEMPGGIYNLVQGTETHACHVLDG